MLSKCQQWILYNSTESFEHDYCDADVCPPDEIFAIASGFQCLSPSYYKGSDRRTCYLSWSGIYTGSWRDGTWTYAKSVSNFNFLMKAFLALQLNKKTPNCFEKKYPKMYTFSC